VSAPDLSLPDRSRAWSRFFTNPLTAGALLGLVALQAYWNLGTAWTVYLVLAIMGLALVPVIAMLLAGGVERSLVSAFVFSLQFSVSFNLLYDGHAVAGGWSGINISLMFLLAVAYVAYWAFNRWAGLIEPWRTNRSFQRAVIAFVLVSALSFFTTMDRRNSLFGLAGNISLALIALVTCHICSRRDYVQRTWTLMLAMLVVQCFFYTVQRLTNTSFTLEGEVLQNRGFSGRFGGTMGMAPANLATLEMVGLFFTQGRLFSKQWRPKPVIAGIFGYGLLCLLLSLTRSCWVGFLFGSVILMSIAIRRGTMRLRTVAAMAGIGMLALVIAWGPVHDRLGANHQGAADERFLLNYINIEMIKAHPLVGIGLNQCYLSRWRYIPSFYTDGDWIYMAHNQYLLIGAETGLLGLASFLWLLWVSVRSAWKAAHADDVVVKEAGTIAFVSLLGMLWGMYLDFYGGMQVYFLLWFIMGFAAGVGRLAEKPEPVDAVAA
jgi:O-antigen ligase